MTSNGEISIMDSVTQILTKLNHLPLEQLLTSVTEVVESAKEPIVNADKTLIELKKTVANLNRVTNKKSFEILPDELSQVLKETAHTLKTTRKVIKGYGDNSLMQTQLAETLKILTKTSLEMSTFLKMLNRKPNSLIFGDN
jgi:paraquat-inducible protein B